MASRKTTIVTEAKTYLSSFNTLKGFIKEAQKIELVTTYFQFLDQISTDIRISVTYEKDVIEKFYPYLTTFQNRFNAELSEFNTLLHEIYNRSKPKVSKQIALELNEALDGLSNELESEKLKSKIRKSFTHSNRYKSAKYFGLIMPEERPNVWQEFSTDMLDRDYLFDDYISLLFSMLNAIIDQVDCFDAGYKKNAKHKFEKIDLTKKVTYGLRDIIPDKWQEFERICKYYSQERTFKNGEDDTAINYMKSKDEYHWEGICDSAIPTLAQFINALKNDDFFAFPKRKRISICDSFLTFFHLPFGYEKAKYLSKEMRNKENLYIGFFTAAIV